MTTSITIPYTKNVKTTMIFGDRYFNTEGIVIKPEYIIEYPDEVMENLKLAAKDYPILEKIFYATNLIYHCDFSRISQTPIDELREYVDILTDGINAYYAVIDTLPIELDESPIQSSKKYVELAIQRITRKENKTGINSNKTAKKGYVYIMKMDCDPPQYKIGQSKNPDNRLSNINTATPFKVTLLDSVYVADMDKVERVLHDEYKHKNVSGEWFELSKNDIALITDVMKSWECNNE